VKLPYGDQAQDQRIKRTREIRHSEGPPAPSRARTCCCQEHRGYAVVKNHMKGLPSLQIRHSGHGGTNSWTVRATWADGTFEEISGFQNEADANDWITNKFPIWLEELNKARQSC
jgi:hypothetical protein